MKIPSRVALAAALLFTTPALAEEGCIRHAMAGDWHLAATGTDMMAHRRIDGAQTQEGWQFDPEYDEAGAMLFVFGADGNLRVVDFLMPFLLAPDGFMQDLMAMPSTWRLAHGDVVLFEDVLYEYNFRVLSQDESEALTRAFDEGATLTVSMVLDEDATAYYTGRVDLSQSAAAREALLALNAPAVAMGCDTPLYETMYDHAHDSAPVDAAPVD